ncbi:NADH:ubiquinone oxidoreductase complex I intermediate-associated protein 30 [Cellulophaga algicola DSM 14237]|uniref:NADH:ubiquinone oxidoreductase complex I intermediate-associated protein 30 n=2 Tax=Cellulophaga TaxID=104264 RepID=E6X8E6_CELAD|nr:CIA30 family protein [Cellulophaga algicola]ADV50802.1 NADH:ubiquinone oxidoreductase complex I intermediate-associated protein 30 [Cellulophaga algicola DSM 14237]
MQSLTVFKFDENSDISTWSVIDDVVMGGKSSGKFYQNKEGKGIFDGHVSLEDNGGFSSLRYQFEALDTSSYSKITITIKGDGKSYKLRFKTKQSDSHSYITHFNTSKKWETLSFSLAEMTPIFRGRKLDLPNYKDNTIEEIAFIIGNKKEEDFMLELGAIILE